jgi:hypothetical protein
VAGPPCRGRPARGRAGTGRSRGPFLAEPVLPAGGRPAASAAGAQPVAARPGVAPVLLSFLCAARLRGRPCGPGVRTADVPVRSPHRRAPADPLVRPQRSAAPGFASVTTRRAPLRCSRGDPRVERCPHLRVLSDNRPAPIGNHFRGIRTSAATSRGRRWLATVFPLVRRKRQSRASVAARFGHIDRSFGVSDRSAQGHGPSPVEATADSRCNTHDHVTRHARFVPGAGS